MKAKMSMSGRSTATIHRHLAENLKKLNGQQKPGQKKQKGGGK